LNARCPHLAQFNPLDPGEVADPYPTFAVAQREEPVFYNPVVDAWYVTRYDDVAAVMHDTKRFTNLHSMPSGVPEEVGPDLPDGYPWECRTFINNDPPGHTRIRKLSAQALRPGVVAAREPEIRGIVDDLIDGFIDAGRVDLVPEFAIPLPSIVIARILGIPENDREQFGQWSDDMVALLAQEHLSPEERVAMARRAVDFYRYCHDFVELRRREPKDDLMTLFVAAEVEGEPAFTTGELISVLSQLLIAGNETTSRLIGNMVLRLTQHPDQLAEVRRDDSLIPRAVEETLRHMSPVKALFRTATEDVELGGATIPAGATVLVSWAAANHDSKHFVEPERFDIHRQDVGDHMAFGRGAHFCPGAPLARLEAKIALEHLLRRLPNVHRADDGPLEYTPTPFHHGLLHLVVCWDRVASPVE
jgi:cytochrome P450